MYYTCASYSTIAWGASLDKGKGADVDYHLRATTTPGKVFGFLGGLGDVAFAYSGHNVVLEIQATIPSTPEKPSKKAMWKGAFVAYVIVALCYFPVTFVGYWAFGSGVDENILITLSKPKWLIALANMFVVIHVIGSYQVHTYISLFHCCRAGTIIKLSKYSTYVYIIVSQLS
jgi:amino acid permease